MYWAILTTILAGLVLLYLLGAFNSRIAHVPGPAGTPLLGHVLHLRSANWHWLLTRWCDDYGGIYRLNLFGGTLVVVSDPVLATSLLLDASEMPKDPKFYKSLSELFHPMSKPNILTAPADSKLHRVVRRALSKSFAASELSEDCECAKDKALLLARRIAGMFGTEPGEPVSLDISDLSARLGLDVLALSKFGYDPQGVESDAKEAMMLKLMTECCQEWFVRAQFPSRSWLWMVVDDIGSKRQLYFILQAFAQHMWQDILALGEPTDSNVTVAAQLMRLRQHPDVQLGEQQLLAELGSIMLHGGLAAGHQLAWTLYQLAANPQAQNRVVDELDAAGLLGKASSLMQLKVEQLSGMKYLDAVIRESMRTQPVWHMGTFRRTNRAIQVGKMRLPKGTRLWINFHAMFNSKRYFERPSEFLPERWLQPTKPASDGRAQPAAADAAVAANGSTDAAASRDGTTDTGAAGSTSESAKGASKAPSSPAVVDGWLPFPQPGAAPPPEEAKKKEVKGATATKQFGLSDWQEGPPLSNPAGHIPFSLGSHACPAQGYTRVFLSTALVALLSFYRFELRNTGLDEDDSQEDAPASQPRGPRRGKGGMVEKADLLLQPDKGLKLRCYLRGVPSQPESKQQRKRTRE